MSASDRRQQRVLRFRQMAEDRVGKLNLLWVQAEEGSDSAVPNLLRELHTHKGDASITGFVAVAALAHALEGAVKAMTASGTPSAVDGDLFLSALDLMKLTVLEDPSTEQSPTIQQMVQHLGSRTTQSLEQQPKPPPPAERRASESKGIPRGRSHDDLLRVQPAQLDRMREIVGELILARGRLHSSAGRVRKERHSASRDRGAVSEAELALRLETTLADLEVGLSDDVVQLTNLVGALDELTRELRMIPIADLFARYPRYARDLGRELGKEVRVKIAGDAAHLDREVLNRLTEPILHLVRNAIDHGIESPQKRREASKQPHGTLSLSAQLRGNSIEIVVADDGCGIDTEGVRRKAIERGFLEEEDTDPAAILQTLLAPGMTTRAKLTEISGRGIGLDVVDDVVRQLEGRLTIESKRGEGTSFVLSVPISGSISSVLTFRVGRSIYALPAASIVAIEHESDQSYVDSLYDTAIEYREEVIEVIDLEKILGRDGASGAVFESRVLIARDHNRLLALRGAEDFAQRDAVLKPAGELLHNNDLVTAGCPLDNGEVAMMLNLSYLSGRQKTRTDNDETAEESMTALIADDSPIILDMLSELLRSLGMEVIEAEDGADALQKLERHASVVDIVITDLDMPKVDGIELIKAIRARPGRRLPAIVVSTRASESDREQAFAVGADDYLVKTTLRADNLRAVLSKYLDL